MDMKDELAGLSERVSAYLGQLVTEEATKNAIVMPFIKQVLGYDVFDPNEVIPEFVCDIGTKKGEKIDYAIKHQGQVQILIEVKRVGDALNLDHAHQLVRYFHVSQARIGILTNGQHWHFFTDLDKPNCMDDAPFLRLDMLNIDPHIIRDLKKLTREGFDLPSVIDRAEQLKYVSAIKQEISRLFESPDEDFVRLLACRVSNRKMTERMKEFFHGITETAMKQFINDQINERLKSALQDKAPTIGATPEPTDAEALAPVQATTTNASLIETTEEELEGFHIVRAIVGSEVAINRVVGRDTQSYFGILLDDNNRKPIARLHFNGGTKYLGIFDNEKNQTRIPLECIEEIYAHADALRSTVAGYLLPAGS